MIVDTTLGPGLLESIYEECLKKEFDLRNIPYKSQVSIPIEYKGLIFKSDYRLDFIVNDKIITELKSVEKLLPVHEAQLLTYLKITKKRLGLLINFNVPMLKTGIKRIIL